MNNLTLAQVHNWSRRTGTVLTERHYELLDYVHGFYETNRVGPLYPNLKRHRAGTENVPYIAAMGLASKLMHDERDAEQQRPGKLRDYFLQRLSEIEPNHIVNGTLEDRVAHNLNIGFPGIDSGAMLLSLNQMWVYVSSGSACHAGATEASHVIRALGVDTEKYGTIRFSFGLRTDQEKLDYLFQYLGRILEMLRQDSEKPEPVAAA